MVDKLVNKVEYEIKCKHCGRFLGSTDKSVEVTVKCSNSKCKKLETYKIEFLSDHINAHQDRSHTDSCQSGYNKHNLPNPDIEQVNKMKDMASKLDGRTKEAKYLEYRITEMENYIKSLEDIIDGQG